MSKKTDQVVSIRVPKGLPEELRLRTGVPFSTIMRHMAITLVKNERQKAAAAKQQKESPSDDNPQS